MNILQIVSSSRMSGAEKHVTVLSDRLRQRGHKVTILCPPGGWLPEQLRALEIPTLEMPMHGTRFWPTALNIARLAQDYRIDLIHTHLTCATYHGFFSGRLSRLPVVSSVHVLSHDFVYRWLLPRRGNRIITVSEFVRNGLLKQGVPPSRIRTIYNGTEFCQEEADGVVAATGIESHTPPRNARTAVLDPATLDLQSELPVRAELNVPPDAELVGIFGHVHEFKGHPILVQAARAIVAARPRTYFVCVGGAQPQVQRMLWELAAADGMAERLRFTGMRNDVQRLMAAMDVVTLPSRYEACSMAIIEAMAMGKPVVATQAGGNAELVLNDQTGLLIDRNPPALATALVSILGDADRKRSMGEAARCRAEERFSARVMTRNVESLYEEMLGQSPPTPNRASSTDRDGVNCPL